MSDKDGFIKLSASSCKTYEQCSRKYFYTYIDKQPKLDHDYFLLGNLCHETLELFHGSYLQSKVPKTKLKALMTSSFAKVQQELKPPQEMAIEAFGLLGEYLDRLLKDGMPNVKGVELPFEFELSDSVVIRGFIDRIDYTDTGLKIVDYKTTKNTKYLDPFQLSIYGLWLRKENPALERYDAAYLLLRHKSTEKAYTITATDLDHTHKDLLNYAQKIKGESTWATSPSILCRWCDFNNICEGCKSW